MYKIALFISRLVLICLITLPATAEQSTKGNVIFIHPDGTGVGHWNLLRLLTVGPDGMTNWDQMEQLGLYRPHQKNSIVTTSHAGATVHAYGKKVHFDSYGKDRTTSLTALSGKSMSLMQEAMAAGIRVGTINSGHIAEPGTGVYLASSDSRKNRTEITEKVLSSGANLIFSGGEVYTLPKGTIGRHGQEGVREDGRDLLAEAKQAGYQVIYTKEELFNLSPDTDKVIGIFAAMNTYNAKSEETLKQSGLSFYNAEQPGFDEMVKVALTILGYDQDKQFFLVAEEEGTDNFSNANNAPGLVEALKRADSAIGISMDYIKNRKSQDTLLVVAADSDAGHPTVWGNHMPITTELLPLVSESGAPLDGISGTGTEPFVTVPDSNGVSYKFGVAWPLKNDSFGSVVSRAHGYRSELLKNNVDNTDIYKISYEVLFSKPLPR